MFEHFTGENKARSKEWNLENMNRSESGLDLSASTKKAF